MNPILEILKGFVLTVWNFILSILLIFVPKRFFFKDVKNQIVLITGGGSGFGRILAYKFAVDHGSIVVIWDINQQGLNQTMTEVRAAGGKCFSYIVDVSSREAIYKVAKQVKSEVGIVNILINNAGIGKGISLEEAKDEFIEKLFQINILSHYWTVKAFLPDMVKEGKGHIVTMSSIAGFFGAPRMSHYCGSKFAAVGFHESISAEIAFVHPEADIHTTLICPFFTKTPMIAGVEDEIMSNVFFPIREAEPVVQEMVEGILTNEDLIITSLGCRVLVFLKAIIPSRVAQTMRKTITKLARMVKKNK